MSIGPLYEAEQSLIAAACGLDRGGKRAPGSHVSITVESWQRLVQARRVWAAAAGTPAASLERANRRAAARDPRCICNAEPHHVSCPCAPDELEAADDEIEMGLRGPA